MLRDRQRNEAVLLSVLALAAVLSTRSLNEPFWILAIEQLVTALSVAIVWRHHSRRDRDSRPTFLRYAVYGAAIVAPAVVAFVASRAMGISVPNEILAMTLFGLAALTLAIVADTSRTRAMSLVASGFLILFATSISDRKSLLVVTVAWISVCVWHLVANRWERLELCQAHQVQRSTNVRTASVLFAALLCSIALFAFRHPSFATQRFAWGFMPTSGGSQWSDPNAGQGVGTGDAVIAARKHAESFGAVDSDIFIESTESTLFDMFSETLGEPKKGGKSERRQSLTPENLITSHQDLAVSQKNGNASFSADRSPPQKHQHFKNVDEPAVLQWMGPTGIRLAMQRFDTYRDHEWTSSQSHGKFIPQAATLQSEPWFMDQRLANELYRDPAPKSGVLKVMRLNTTQIPTPMLTAGVHVRDVQQADFFCVDASDCWAMPGRERIPPLTVIHLLSTSLMEDQLHQITATPGNAASSDRIALSPETQRLLEQMIAQWTTPAQSPYQQLSSVVEHLRSGFQLDRSIELTGDDPVADFLTLRRGGPHLFATTAALIARQLGLRSRLVTGFYVRPSGLSGTTQPAAILADDVHAWVEIALDDHHWFEIEPTPGYQPPRYRPSLWLQGRQAFMAVWPALLGISGIGTIMFLTRTLWIEGVLLIFWYASRMLPIRRRLALAMQIIQWRAKHVGRARPAGSPQRDWLLELVSSHSESPASLRPLVQQFCDLADRLCFAPDAVIDHRESHAVMNRLVRHLKRPVLRPRVTRNHTQGLAHRASPVAAS